MAEEITITLDSPSLGLLEARAKENGTTMEYEAMLVISRELASGAKKFVAGRPSEG